MKELLKYLIFFSLPVICSTCIIPFETDVTRYEDALIIDAILTDEPESSVVRLSRSVPISLSNFQHHKLEVKPDSDALVFIKDDLGNVYEFYETIPGEYRAVNPDFSGIAGRSYQLYMISSDEQTYESEFVTLTKVPEIDSLYAEFGKDQGDEGVEEGIHIYIDTHDPENNTRFYRYEYEETWEITVPYPSMLVVVGNSLEPRNESLQRCWRTFTSSDIIIISNEKLEANVIRKFPIHFVSVETNRLSTRYSILVKQYSMRREAYAFWDQLKTSNQDQGTLFDSQVMQPRGNICNCDDPESPVIGFFEASSVSRKRIFLTNRDVPVGVKIVTGYEYCRHRHYTIPVARYDPDGNTDCIVAYTTYYDGSPGLLMTRGFNCCDCRLDGSNIRPDFW